MTYIEFCVAIKTLALHANFSVTSWWRSHERNRKVGGVSGSWHLSGRAIDLIPDSDMDKAKIIKMAVGHALEVIDEGDHLHIEPKG
ncbi:hypothetical protein LCGC14_1389870 [marine sediment metagenome]|uniref:Peptidase M15A C-terminal domain-containing protein n=1 Tax=marine sediment metagenome TaxID=412755 RepID=A0A0F9MFU8_9ZZZZ